jgi:hypothetical protein
VIAWVIWAIGRGTKWSKGRGRRASSSLTLQFRCHGRMMSLHTQGSSAPAVTIGRRRRAALLLCGSGNLPKAAASTLVASNRSNTIAGAYMTAAPRSFSAA